MSDRILSTQEALSLEARSIFGAVIEPQQDSKDFNQQLGALGATALCLSGGGIRSATFALGILQALAKHGLLSRFHYLSTVSGGGYIGGWLSRWIRAEQTGTEEGRAKSRADSIDAVEQGLRPGVEPLLGRIRQLRDNALYLTPRSGLASPDLWTAIVIVTRNILLNWLLIGPVLVLVAMVPILALSFADRLTAGDVVPLMTLGAVLVLAATLFTYSSLPSAVVTQPGSSTADLEAGTRVNRFGDWPILAQAGLLSMIQSPLLTSGTPTPDWSDLLVEGALHGWASPL
jgi:hypothetical protein